MAEFLDATWLDMVPQGWQKKFIETCDRVAVILEEFGIPQKEFHFVLIKEKWGSLRVLYDLDFAWNEDEENPPPESWDRVFPRLNLEFENLEEETRTLCVKCGDTATMVSEGYALPFCECCAIAYNRAANARHKTDVPIEKAFRKI